MAKNCGENSDEGNKKVPPTGKITKGRRKIEIKRLEKKNNLQVTFSKRRNGLFKKASELRILSGSKIGIVVLSPSPREKPFSFGHPNIEKVLDRYLGDHQKNPTDDSSADDHHHHQQGTANAVISRDDHIFLPGFEEINKKFEGSVEELDNEKTSGKEMENVINIIGGGFWWDEEIERMGLEELEIYLNSMEDAKKNVIVRANALTMENVMETTSAPVADDDRGSGFGFAQN